MDNTQYPYTIELLGKQVTINKDTYEWNLKYDNLTAILSNPVSEAAEGTRLTVNAVLHHNIGYDYYLENAAVPYGYRTNDCSESILSLPVAAVPVPLSVPTVQPLPVPKPILPPAAPVAMPTSTETYFVRTTIPCYPHYSMASQRINSCGQATMGQYYVWRKFNGMLNITRILGQSGSWINPADNKIIPPAVADLSQKPANWKSSYQSFKDEAGNPVTKSYQVSITSTVYDLAGQRKDKRIYAGQFYDIAGWFMGPDGNDYLRPAGAAAAYLWYGIEEQYLTPEDEVYNTSLDHDEKKALHRLSWQEQAVDIVGRVAGRYTYLKRSLHKNKTRR